MPTIALPLLAVGSLAAAVGVALAPRTLSKARSLDVGALGRHVLIVVPHPDDEVLTAGGTIHRLVASGARVRIVFVTEGDGYLRAARRLAQGPARPENYLALADVRHAEALKAAAALGIDPGDVVSLGFPDGGIGAILDAPAGVTAPVRSRRTGSDAVPYSWALVPEAPYTKHALIGALAAIVRDFAPTAVITPSAHETHGDHAAIAGLAQAALDETGFTGRHLTALVHYRLYPYPWGYVPSRALEPPPSLLGPATTWHSVDLDDRDHAAKRTAMACYVSQTAILDLRFFMNSFVRRNELFAESVPATD